MTPQYEIEKSGISAIGVFAKSSAGATLSDALSLGLAFGARNANTQIAQTLVAQMQRKRAHARKHHKRKRGQSTHTYKQAGI